MAIINYAIQSELNVYLLHALQIKVERREHGSLDAAIKVSHYEDLLVVSSPSPL